MSRPSAVPPPRTLTLMEELEKLEQSITLTLQEIDHNFSRAHRIVTTSILPVVEDYAKNSTAVWEGSKFWKGFFEASANVKLSSYEETAEGEETTADETQTLQEHEFQSPGTDANHDDTTITPDQRPTSRYRGELGDSSPSASSPSEVGRDTLPRIRPSVRSPRKAFANAREEEASFAEYPSPYETLRQEMATTTTSRKKPAVRAPTTPGHPTLTTSIAQLPESSPFLPSTHHQQSMKSRNQDPLLYRVLDKNYRIQATPLTSHKTGPPLSTAQATIAGASRVLEFSSPFSPPVAAPQLRSEIFGSPVRAAPRTPGISVQKTKERTPRPAFSTRHGRDGSNLFSPQKAAAPDTSIIGAVAKKNETNTWDSDTENDGEGRDTLDELGMSPPKTIQFHIPASRLLQTPAREASKRIVEDLLMTAGMGSATSTLEDLRLRERGGANRNGNGIGEGWGDDEDGMVVQMEEDDSPSVVRVARRDADADAF